MPTSMIAALVLAAAGVDAPPDYSRSHAWVCRGDRAPCRDDLTAAVIGSDGAVRPEPFRPAARPPVDCFYVYPTVSEQKGLAAEPVVTQAEKRAVRQQVARLSSVCRIYAPVYRQITTANMRPGAAPRPRDAMRKAGERAQADVIAAWDAYMRLDNRGRGVVVIGHSQGAAMAIGLIAARIDGQAAQRQLVSAILPGAFVLTPRGRTTGGTFQAIPPCRADAQTGCVIAFNSIRAERPFPTDKAMPFPGQEPVCTNPAALAGGEGELRAYLSSSGETIIPMLTARQSAWTRTGQTITQPFVTLPGLLHGECRSGAGGAFLEVSVRPAPGDQRLGQFVGDWMTPSGKAEPTMGLHLIDLNLVAGNLQQVMARQSAAYLTAQASAGGAGSRTAP